MDCNDWNVNLINIFRMSAGEGEGEKSVELVLANKGFPADDPVLQDHLDGLLVEAFKKKPDTGETCGCKVWTFQGTPPGQEDRELFQEALETDKAKTFQTLARRITGRYLSLPGTKPGLIFFLNVRITPKKGQGGNYFVMFVCEFEELRRYDPHIGHLEPVEDAVQKKCRKALIYPFFNGYDFDREKVKLVQVGAKEGSLSDLFYLEPPRTTQELLEEELREAVVSRHDANTYEGYFEKELPKERELFGEERYINLDDLLKTDDVVHLSKASYQSALDKHGKKSRVRIVVDEGVKFEGQLDKLGVNYFFARKGEAKFLIIKGEKFLTKSQLSSIEFLDVQDLEEVIPRVTRED